MLFHFLQSVLMPMTTLSGCRDHFRFSPVFGASIHVAEKVSFYSLKKIRFCF